MNIVLRYPLLILVFFSSPDVVIFDHLLSASFSFLSMIFLLVICLRYVRFSYFSWLFLLCSLVILIGGIFRVKSTNSFSFLFGDLFFLFVNYVVLNAALRFVDDEYLDFHFGSKFLPIFLFASFVLCFVYFDPFFVFTDHSGHTMYLFWGGLTSSVYRFGGAQFVRFSGVFDEPGTFGLFVSLVISINFMTLKSFNFRWFLVGVTSLSLSYFFWLLSFFVYVFRVRFFLSFLFIFGFLFFVIYRFSDFYLVELYVDRFFGVFTGNTNRSGGNSLALDYLSGNLFGAPEKIFANRFFESSGLFVYAAYKGVFVIVGHLLLFLYFFVVLFQRFGFYVVPFTVSFVIVLLTRNNIFYTSFSLQVFWILLYFRSARKG